MNTTKDLIELKPTTQKSFYGKAEYAEFWEEINSEKVSHTYNLYSYDSMVCEVRKEYINKDKNKDMIDIVIYFPSGSQYHSATTCKHKRAFLEMLNIFDIVTWKEIKDYEIIEINLINGNVEKTKY